MHEPPPGDCGAQVRVVARGDDRARARRRARARLRGTNGLHDASNAIAALVATRAARPAQAIALAAVFNLLGPLLLGAAVADTVGGIVTVQGSSGVAVIAAAWRPL